MISYFFRPLAGFRNHFQRILPFPYFVFLALPYFSTCQTVDEVA